MRWPRPDTRDIKRAREKFLSWIWRKEENYGNLTVFSPFMWLSFRSRFSRKINATLLSRQIKGMCKRHKINNPVLVTTLPIAADLFGKLGEVKSIYYCVDEFSQWPGMMKDVMREMEDDLIKKVDLILAASDKLYHDKKGAKCPDYLFPHGVDIEHFTMAASGKTKVPQDIADIKRPIIGLYGSFDERTDFDVITHISATHPDWSIVLIRSMVTRILHLSKLHNVFIRGQRAYELLPY